jgi:hypothetical protein
VFQSGLAFRIWNKPVKNGYLWDIKLFWLCTMDGALETANKDPKGFDTLDDCLDDILTYIEEHNNKNKKI